VPLSRNLGTLTYWNPLGHSRPVTGLLYLLVLVSNFVYWKQWVSNLVYWATNRLL